MAAKNRTGRTTQMAHGEPDSSNVWIFQAVPRRYNLIREVRRRRDTWTVPRLRKRMRKGHLVLFWKAGQDAGIYARGTVDSERPFKRGGEWLIYVTYAGLLPNPVLKKSIERHPVLRDLTIIRMPRGTNFSLTRAQWRALQPLLNAEPAEIPKNLARQVVESGAFNPKNIKDARKKTLGNVFVRRGQPQFRRKLMDLYGGTCMVTNCDAKQALEAAHIVPYKGEKTDDVRNGLLLRSDIHTLFDLRLIAIDTTKWTLVLAPSLKYTAYGRLQAKKLFIPRNCPRPSKEELDQHRKLAGF
jgi:hypothetical protein